VREGEYKGGGERWRWDGRELMVGSHFGVNSKVITVINRSEVVGRPLAALLANDGARVLSVDIDCECWRPAPSIEPTPPGSEPLFVLAAIVEFSKRPITSTAHTSKYNPHHIMTPLPSDFTLQSALAVSDVVISAVPSKNYKVKTEWLKDGCICVNVAGDKNFEADVRDKVSDDGPFRNPMPVYVYVLGG
jgi:methylenetetrahydrofolate dehydrogenase (NAD+)